MIGAALSLLNYEPTSRLRYKARCALAGVLRARLTAFERQSLAWATLAACGEDDAQTVIDALLPYEKMADGPPLPLDSETLAADARLWVAAASRRERLAYALALLDALTSRDCAALRDAATAAGSFETRLRRLSRSRRAQSASRDFT